MSEVDGGGVPLLNNPSGPAGLNLSGEVGPSINNTMNVIRNNNNLNPILNVRDRLHHALFKKAALTYARIFPRPVRRFIEFMVLLKAISTFFVLAYVHIVFSRTPTNCLEHIRDEWPRDGILRVEILRSGAEDYSIEKSYAKEERLRQEKVDDLTSALGLLAGDGFINIEPSAVDEDRGSISTSNEDSHENLLLTEKEMVTRSIAVSGEMQDPDISTTNTTISPSLSTPLWSDSNLDEKESPGDTIIPLPNLDGNLEDASSSKNDSSEALKDKNSDADKSISAEDSYIVEYSLEYGFLRLSPLARQRLNIPVKIVTLDPLNDKCFGDGFSRIILDKFLGYNDILMASIKTLAQHEDNKGFFRNVVTGEQYRFVSMWMAKTSYLPAFFFMLAFTMSISMLLCYTHHQIFVFVVEFMQMLEFNLTVSLPAASVLIMLLALIGLEAIMSDFFNDYKTAFYVILTVWMANQYDAICCYTPITKRHWLRFFYLYHFLFYAYHYRFNGEHSRLALTTSLLFMFHSMLYFFHHYELPVILQQTQLPAILEQALQVHRHMHRAQPEMQVHRHLHRAQPEMHRAQPQMHLPQPEMHVYRHVYSHEFPGVNNREPLPANLPELPHANRHEHRHVHLAHPDRSVQVQVHQSIIDHHPEPYVAAPGTAPTTTTEQTQQNYIAELSQLDPDPSNPEEQQPETTTSPVSRENTAVSTTTAESNDETPRTETSTSVEDFEVIDAADETIKEATTSQEDDDDDDDEDDDDERQETH